jgi:hypothetical protein
MAQDPPITADSKLLAEKVLVVPELTGARM